MPRLHLLTIAILFTVASSMLSFAAGAGDVAGTWLNQKQDARIEIFQCGNNYCGKIVWLKEPVYPAGSKEGTPGTPKLDTKNPDASRRKTPLLDLQIMQGFQYAGDNLWKSGTIYDPDIGKTYSSKITLVSPDQLDLRGFIGISLL